VQQVQITGYRATVVAWHGAPAKARSGARQKLQNVRLQSPFAFAHGQAQSGQVGQKIVLSFELADHSVEFGHFGVVINLFLLPLAKEVSCVFNQFLLPAIDLGRMNLILAGKFRKSLQSGNGSQGDLGLKLCAVVGAMLHGTFPIVMDRFIAYTPVSKEATTSLPDKGS